MQLSQSAQAAVAAARAALARRDLGAARTQLAAAAAASDDEVTALRLRLGALQLSALLDGAAAVVTPLAEVGERARRHGRLFALFVLERGEQLRALALYAEAARHAAGMIAWARDLGWRALEAAAALSLGRASFEAGHFAEARDACAAGLRALAAADAPDASDDDGGDGLDLGGLAALPTAAALVASLTLHLGRAAYALGERARARECLDVAASAPLDAVERGLLRQLALDLGRDDGAPPAAALASLADGLDGGSRLQVELWCQAALAEPLDVALTTLTRADAVAGDAAARVPVALTRALVLRDHGHLAEAEAALPAAAALQAAPDLVPLAGLAAAAIALAGGRPAAAAAPATEALLAAELQGDLGSAAAAAALLATTFRLVGAVAPATAHRQRAVDLYVRAGRRDALPALEVERAWIALIEGDRAGAAAALAALPDGADVDDVELAIALGLCSAALARVEGRPHDALATLLAAYARSAAAAPPLTLASLALAIERVAAALGQPLPAPVRATLDWAARAGVPALDPLQVPPPAAAIAGTAS